MFSGYRSGPTGNFRRFSLAARGHVDNDKTAAGRSLGNSETISKRASIPPLEAPITMISWPDISASPLLYHSLNSILLTRRTPFHFANRQQKSPEGHLFFI